MYNMSFIEFQNKIKSMLGENVEFETFGAENVCFKAISERYTIKYFPQSGYCTLSK